MFDEASSYAYAAASDARRAAESNGLQINQLYSIVNARLEVLEKALGITPLKVERVSEKIPDPEPMTVEEIHSRGWLTPEEMLDKVKSV